MAGRTPITSGFTADLAAARRPGAWQSPAAWALGIAALVSLGLLGTAGGLLVAGMYIHWRRAKRRREPGAAFGTDCPMCHNSPNGLDGKGCPLCESNLSVCGACAYPLGGLREKRCPECGWSAEEAI